MSRPACLCLVALAFPAVVAAQPNEPADFTELIELIEQQAGPRNGGLSPPRFTPFQADDEADGEIVPGGEGGFFDPTDGTEVVEDVDPQTQAKQARETAAEIRTFLKRRITANPQDGPQAVTNLPDGVTLLIERPGIGSHYFDTQHFYFGCELRIVNDREEPLKVHRDDMRLSLNGVPQPLGTLPAEVEHEWYDFGDASVQLADLHQADSLALLPGESGVIGLVVPNFGGSPALPPIRIEVPLCGRTAVVDVQRHELGRMQLTAERVGPGQTLARFTIGGPVNIIGWNVLLDEIEALNDSGEVGLFLVAWTDDAPRLGSDMEPWVRYTAETLGRFEEDDLHDVRCPDNNVTSLHWANVPNDGEQESLPPLEGSARFHRTVAEGVTAALAPILDRLPPQAIVRELRVGDPDLRPALLAVGSARLGPAHLPLVMSYLDSEDEAVRIAALRGLRHFAADAARERLLRIARDAEATAAERLAAVESLAASRFPALGRALVELITDPGFQLTPGVMRVLIQHPRPEWSSAIDTFLRTDPEEGVAEAIGALHELGHPDLVDHVRKAFARDDDELHSVIFPLFLGSDDPEIRDELLRYTLAQIEEWPPTQEMAYFLSTTRDPRAVPLLLKHLRKEGGVTDSLIELLVELGDARVAKTLRELYPRLDDEERAIALNALWEFQSPDILKLTRSAVQSTSYELVVVAAEILSTEASDEAVVILGEAFRKAEHDFFYSTCSEALSEMGTGAALAMLQTLQRETNDEERRAVLCDALENVFDRSPADSARYRADEALEEQEYEEAIKAAEIGLRIDPGHPGLLQVLGAAQLELGKTAEGVKSLERAVEQNIDDQFVLIQLALAYVRDGQVERGVKYVEQRKSRFKHDAYYMYNTACVYGRAVEQARQADVDTKLARRSDEYARQAIENLKAAVRLGFDEQEFAAEDPDLAAVRDHPDFDAAFEVEVSEDAPWLP